MLYELRVYDSLPGKMDALNDRFANHTTGYFKKYGIGMFGFWTNEIGVGNRLTYIVTFDSMADRESRWDSFQADTGWQRARVETETDGPLVAVARNTFMRLTPYSPEPVITSRIQELRTYEAMPGKMAGLHNRLGSVALPLFKKNGIEVIAFWTEDVGANNKLIYMLGYPGLGEREKLLEGLRADSDWREAMAASNKRGEAPQAVYNTIMRLTSYSPGH